MLCGGEPLVVPHFLARRRSARQRRRAAQDRNQRPALRRARSPSGWRACRSARSRSASTATPRRSTQRQRPGASLAKAHAACRAVRAAGLPLEDHVRADAAQHSRGRSRSSSGRARSARSASTPASSCASARPRACGTGSSRRAEQYGEFREVLDADAGGARTRRWSFATVPSTMDGGSARQPRDPAGDAAGAAERLGQGGGGAAAHLCRFAPRYAGRRPGRRYRDAWRDETSRIDGARSAIEDTTRHARRQHAGSCCRWPRVT